MDNLMRSINKVPHFGCYITAMFVNVTLNVKANCLIIVTCKLTY
jgi:hypothetical protein